MPQTTEPATVTKFGLNQIGNTTPQWATNIFRIALYAGAIATIVLSTITEIPDSVKLVIAKYTLEGITLIHALSKMFGITIQNDPTVNQN
jgi:hypothetical protein